MEFAKTIGKRFLRAFFSGFIASAILVVPSTVSDYKDLGNWLSALILAGLVGGITGSLMAIDKILRWQE